MRNKYTKRFNSTNGLPLFDWSDTQRRFNHRPTAGQRLLMRRGYPRSTAKLYAGLAGLPVEGDD